MTKSPIFLAIRERTAYNSSMKSSYTDHSVVQYITNYLYSLESNIKPLSHSGKSMLSGMTAKPSTVTTYGDEMKVYLGDGGTIKVIKPRRFVRHFTKSKSYKRWSTES